MTALTVDPITMTTRQRLILVLLLGSQFMLAVDFSILNVALPEIGRGLGFSMENLQWIATAMMLPSAGFTLLFGRIADLAGRRRMLLAGMVLLAAGSLAGGLADSPGVLLAARVAQGLAAALATPAALSLLTTSFPEGPLRDRALGLNGTLLSAGFTAGAVFGGLLTDLLSWRWAFFVNVPVAAAVVLAAPGLLPESRSEERTGLDVPGALTVTGGMLALVYGVTTASWPALALAVALLAAFWLIERRAAAPLAPIGVLTRHTVRGGNLGGLVTFTMESSLIFLLTLYLQNVLSYTPLQTGLVFAVLGAAAFAGGLLAPRVIGRVGNRAALVGGLVLQGVATGSLVLLGQGGAGSLILVLAVPAAGAVGHLVAIVSYMVTATSGLPDSEQGLATGLASMTQQVGVTLGIPVISAVVAAGDSVLAGVHTAILVNAAIVLVGAAAVRWILRPSRNELFRDRS